MKKLLLIALLIAVLTGCNEKTMNNELKPVNNHVKIYQSAIEKYTTLETAKIHKACYKSFLIHINHFGLLVRSTVLFGERVTKGSKW